ncbi:MAG TPA: hypothetical protein VM869_20995 [Enhygromyxa sp.]|nr:hypothetical protein [Enhygromyxa sp.]
MDHEAPHTHWIAGRIVDGEPLPAGSPWSWLAAVLSLVLAIDLLLGFEAAPAPSSPEAESADVRAQLLAASEAAAQGRPAFVLVGDSVLAGDVMAATVPDWRSQRVIDHMRGELGLGSDAELRQVAFDGLLPVDALRVLAELDRLDPAGEVRFVLELNLRYFSPHYAEQRDCTRPQLCELGRTQLATSTLAHAVWGVIESASLGRDWLRERAPIHRHRAQLEQPNLAELDGLAVARAGANASGPTQAEGLARVQAHYRDSSLDDDHAQAEALAQIIDRLRARERPAALFLTPLEDEFVSATLPGNRLGHAYQQLATRIHDRALAPPGSGVGHGIELLDLDHPLFESAYFLDHVHLDPEGNRLLALNLLHELGLPQRERPFEWMMVHTEDHDRSLVHRRGLGYADGGAWTALFREPEGVAVSPSGDWIVIADTGNHALRQLRGSMQIVERLAGMPRRSGRDNGPADRARLDHPRSPEIVGHSVYFLDGKGRRVRRVVDGAVETLRWSGLRCDRYDELEARSVDGRTQLYLLCADDRVLIVDPDARAAELGFDPRSHAMVEGVRALEPTHDGRLLLADAQSRIWSVALEQREHAPTLLFGNTASELLPQGRQFSYPFALDELRLNRIVGMEWVDRYGALLVQDEHDLGRKHERLHYEQTERVHLRLLDLDAGLIYPWIKAIPHGEAFHMWNEVAQNLVSYYHFGAMAIAQHDASLVYVERERSRVFRIADGLLAAAKSGNHHTARARIELWQPLGNASAREIGETLRPDRYLARRHEPIPRAGPYVGVMVGSSLTAISDRLGNYSLARLLELELQAELGYRDGIRLDLFQRVRSPRDSVDELERFLAGGGPPPDIMLIELHESIDLDRIERLAERHDALVIVYDDSAMLADGHDGLRASSTAIRARIEDARSRGFVVLEPSDLLLRELLVESPWSNQPWSTGLHHGAPWAVELSAKTYASLAYPAIREFLRGRTPAREREREKAGAR